MQRTDSCLPVRFFSVLICSAVILAVAGCGEKDIVYSDDTEAIAALKKAGGKLRRQVTMGPDVTGSGDMFHEVDLRGVSIDDDVIEMLLTIKVTSLKMDYAADEYMKSIASFEHMRVLDVSDSYVTDVGLEALKDHPSLTIFNADNTALTSAGIAHLPERVLRVSLVGVELSDADLRAISKRPALRFLTVTENSQTSSAVVDEIKKSRPGLSLGVRKS